MSSARSLFSKSFVRKFSTTWNYHDYSINQRSIWRISLTLFRYFSFYPKKFVIEKYCFHWTPSNAFLIKFLYSIVYVSQLLLNFHKINNLLLRTWCNNQRLEFIRVKFEITEAEMFQILWWKYKWEHITTNVLDTSLTN